MKIKERPAAEVKLLKLFLAILFLKHFVNLMCDVFRKRIVKKYVCEMFYNLFNEELGDRLKLVFSPDAILCG